MAADPVALVLRDKALFGALLQQMLEQLLVNSLGAMACTCQALRDTAECALRGAVLQACLCAAVAGDETWASHWALARALGGCSAPASRLLLLSGALYGRRAVLGDHSSVEQRWSERRGGDDGNKVAEAECVVAALVGGSSAEGARRVLGAGGAAGLLPLQRRILRGLCVEAGAFRNAPALARLNVSKAMGTALEADTLLDLAEVLNLSAYARTYVSRQPESVAELQEAVAAASRAVRGLLPLALVTSGLPRGHRLLGRSLVSAAHARLSGCVRGTIEEELAAEWGDGAAMFAAARAELQASVRLARQVAVSAAGNANLELGACIAALAECWYCVATVAHRFPQGLLGHTKKRAAAASRISFEFALRVLEGHGETIERADALKDYGKLLSCFRFTDAPDAREMLTLALRIHVDILGDGHPRTRNVKRLLDR